MPAEFETPALEEATVSLLEDTSHIYKRTDIWHCVILGGVSL